MNFITTTGSYSISHNAAPSWAKERAISLLFGDLNISANQYDELSQFIDKCYGICGCVALHYTDREREKVPEKRRDFSQLCDSLGLDPGKKEVIITPHQIKYYEDYSCPKYVILLH